MVRKDTGLSWTEGHGLKGGRFNRQNGDQKEEEPLVLEINHGITWEGERKVEKKKGKEKNGKRGRSRDRGKLV